jgi:chromosome partitioning protein
MKTISIINLKGGVGKTISAANIGHILATVHNKRVLMIDMDKQANLSRFYGADGIISTIGDVLLWRNNPITEDIRWTDYKNVGLIAANMEMISTMLKPIAFDTLNKKLRKIDDIYDYCIIDNPPDINTGVGNALMASDAVIVPVTADNNAVDGLNEIAQQIGHIRDSGKKLSLYCLFTRYQNNALNREALDALKRSEYPCIETVIRYSVKAAESINKRVPIYDYSRRSNASKDYLQLVSELIEKI